MKLEYTPTKRRLNINLRGSTDQITIDCCGWELLLEVLIDHLCDRHGWPVEKVWVVPHPLL